MQHECVRIVVAAAAERPGDGRSDAAADRTGGEHRHHHEAWEHERHAGQRVGAEPRDEPGLDQPGRGLGHHHEHVRPGEQQERRDDRAVQQPPGARAHGCGQGCCQSGRCGRQGGEIGVHARRSWGSGTGAALASRLASRSLVAVSAAGPAASLKSGGTSGRPERRSTRTLLRLPWSRRRRPREPAPRDRINPAAGT